MAKHSKLRDFNTKITRNNNTVVLVSGSRQYYKILLDAFSEYRFGPDFDDQYGRFDWGTYINVIGTEPQQRVERLLTLFQSVVCIEDALYQTFALDYHFSATYESSGRSAIGNLVFNAKYRDNRQAASELAEALIDFISQNPSYMRACCVLSVPPSKQNKTFDLPSFLVGRICERLGKTDLSACIQKVRPTAPMKDLQTEEDKFNNVRGAFEVIDPDSLQGKRVILVDDLYHSGATLHEVGHTLIEAGASAVLGLAGTKTIRDVG